MSSQPTAPIRLARSERDRAAEVLARAFLDDPAYARIFPDASGRARSLRRLFGSVVDYCLANGEVHTSAELAGVACWLPPGRTGFTLWRHLRGGFTLWRAVVGFGAEDRRRFLALLSYADELQKRLVGSRPHWYLLALGVEPGLQGRGIGTSLIQPFLGRCDAAGLPCYLETQTDANVEFYRRLGFAVAAEGEVPGLGMRIWAMIREPFRHTRPTDGDTRPTP